MDDDGIRATTLAVLACAALVILAVGPGGNFPLSDDWSYAYAVQGLCEDGELRMLPWTGASLVLQAWYGALLCKLFGPSFEVLRASTLALAVSGVVGFAMVLRELGVGGGTRGLALVVLGLCPLYVNLAFTFMTDVPFTVLCIWSAWLYLRGLGGGGTKWLLAGALVASASLLVRQHGVFVAAAASAACLLPGVIAEAEAAADAEARAHRGDAGRTRGLRARLADAVAAGTLPALAFIGFHAWLFGVHGAPSGVQDKVSEAGGLSIVGTGNLAFRAIEYLGLLLLPLAAMQAVAVARERPGRLAAAGVTLGSLALFVYARDGELMLYLTNVMHDLGLGALPLRDTLFLGKPPPLHVGPGLGITLTVVSTAAACTLVAGCSTVLGRLGDARHAFVAYAFALLSAGSLLHAAFYFDRYLLPVIPFAIATTLVCMPGGRPRWPAWLAAGALAWWAVAGTHDSMEWNRARYAGIEALEAEGFGAREIDGGVEYNAWALAAELGTWPTKEQATPGKPASLKSWWWVVDDRFVLSFRPLAGYDVRRSLAYPRWLVPGTGHVLVLERSAPRS